jgi:hypothetical protein
MNTITHLKKITLLFEAGTSPENMDLIVHPPEFQFIFGLGSEGMTPFEYKLIDRAEGDVVSFSLKKDTPGHFFEHLQPPLWNLFDGRDTIFFNVKIVAVTPAGNREVLKAMSERVAHGGGGCGCDGGCGCGCG